MPVSDGEFDYIVVGAGSAGCVVANRLSADPKKRVLLLEAGLSDNWIWYRIPVGYLFAIDNPRSDWMYRTREEPGLNGRSLKYPRGKVLGGSSAINAMICMRGQKQDYDAWQAQGLDGWGWEDVQPVFKRIEDHFLGASDQHAAKGEWRVEAPRVRWDILDSVSSAANQMGIPNSDDFNTGTNEGVGYFHVNQKRGTRWSSARGFLKPALKRKNLVVETGVMVDKVELRGNKATGVQFLKGNERYWIQAAREVILCAGSIGSVQILQRSGIGPHKVLRNAGVQTLVDLPGVGQNLQDHLQLRSIYKITGAKTLNQIYHSLLGKIGMGLDYAFRRRGPLTMAPSQLGIFTRSDRAQKRANLQFHIQPLSLDKFGDPLHKFPAMTSSVCDLQPSSRGEVNILSSNVHAKPYIAPNYLSTEDDINTATDAIRVTRKLMSQPALAPYEPEEMFLNEDCRDDDEKLAREIGTTIFHPVGTAKMGRKEDSMSVVDHRLRVHGLDGLRVIDASIMPTITSGNTNTPTIMIADKGAAMVLEDA